MLAGVVSFQDLRDACIVLRLCEDDTRAVKHPNKLRGVVNKSPEEIMVKVSNVLKVLASEIL